MKGLIFRSVYARPKWNVQQYELKPGDEVWRIMPREMKERHCPLGKAHKRETRRKTMLWDKAQEPSLLCLLFPVLGIESRANFHHKL